MKSFLEIMEAASPLKEEVKKLSAYWRTQSVKALHRPSGIDKIILCGRDTALPSVDEYLQAATGIKTEVANVWRNIFSFEDYIPPLPRVDSLDYAGAIGLVLAS
jgi:Tfp pilus assembly PilM family ATPase